MFTNLGRAAGALVLALTLLLFAGCQTEREADVPETTDRIGETEPERDLEPDADLEPDVDLEPVGTEPGAAAEGEAIVTSQFQPGEGAQGGNVQGTLRVVPAGARDLEAQVRVEGLSEGEHAWHIHSAGCGQKAPVVVPFTSTAEKEGVGGPLEAGADGVAEGSAEIPAEQLSRQQIESGSYSVHVHAKGGVDHGPTVACANL